MSVEFYIIYYVLNVHIAWGSAQTISHCVFAETTDLQYDKLYNLS